MRRLAVAFLVITLPLAADPAADLEKILRRLDADDADVRDRAQADLGSWCEATGAEAEAMLKKARDGVSPEVRARIEEQLGVFERGREVRKELGVFFGKAALPCVSGKQRVRFNCGAPVPDFGALPESRFLNGWLLSETEAEIVLLEDDLRVHVRSKKGEFDPEFAKDTPPPGGYEKINFAGECREWMKNRSSVLTGGGEQLSAITLAYAWWASESGLSQVSAACLERAHEDTREFVDRPFHAGEARDFMLKWIAARLRAAADHSAAEGLSRRDLLARWKGIAALPPCMFKEPAPQFIKAYESLLEEDALWTEPPAADLAKADATTRARHWLYHFRDAVSEEEDWDLDEKDRKPKGPWDHLVSLGWDAVPEIAAHLDDWRPTRRIGCGDSNHPEDTYFLEGYADGCVALIEKIAGIEIGDWARQHGMAIGGDDWREDLAKAAQAWWKEMKLKREK